MKYIVALLLVLSSFSCSKIEDCTLSKHECQVFDVKTDTIVMLDKNRNLFVDVKYNRNLFYPYTLCELLDMQFSTPTFILGYCEAHDHYYQSY